MYIIDNVKTIIRLYSCLIPHIDKKVLKLCKCVAGIIVVTKFRVENLERTSWTKFGPGELPTL